MRTIIVVFTILCSLTAGAQQKSIKTETFIVQGNCEECKERIENAADVKGVKHAKWDTDTKVLQVTYDSEKTEPGKIRQAIASHGHDVGDLKAPDKAYKKLPSCCRYREGKCEEPNGK